MVSTAECKCGIWSYSEYISSALQQLGDFNVTILGEYPINNESIDKSIKTKIPIKYCWNRNQKYLVCICLSYS